MVFLLFLMRGQAIISIQFISKKKKKEGPGTHQHRWRDTLAMGVPDRDGAGAFWIILQAPKGAWETHRVLEVHGHAHAQLHLLEGRRPASCTAPPGGTATPDRDKCDAVLPLPSPRQWRANPQHLCQRLLYSSWLRGLSKSQVTKRVCSELSFFQETVTCWRGSRSPFLWRPCVRQV